jgi:F-type H+-transporting ATPase subunit epsilon
MTGSFERIFVDGGFAEVNETGLTILAESAIPVGDIDPEALAKDLAAARDELRDTKSDTDRVIAERRVAKFEAMQAAVTN